MLSIEPGTFVVGTKQVLRVISQQKVLIVHLANDAQRFIADQIRLACEQAGVAIQTDYNKTQLGSACKIAVPAACVAILRNKID